MVHLDKNFNIVGAGKATKTRRLTKGQRAKAVAYVQQLTGLSKAEASKVVTQASKQHKISGGSFWDTLANIGKSIVGSIPVVGAYAKEGIDALQHHRAYNAGEATKEALIDGAFAVIPGASALKGVAKAGVKQLLKTKPRINSGKSTTTELLHSQAEASRKRKEEHEKRMRGGCGTCPHCGGDTEMVRGGAEAVILRRSRRNRRTRTAPAPAPVVYEEEFEEPAPVPIPKRLNRCGSMSKRGTLVRDIMNKMGMTLPEASRYVKANGLYVARH